MDVWDCSISDEQLEEAVTVAEAEDRCRRQILQLRDERKYKRKLQRASWGMDWSSDEEEDEEEELKQIQNHSYLPIIPENLREVKDEVFASETSFYREYQAQPLDESGCEDYAQHWTDITTNGPFRRSWYRKISNELIYLVTVYKWYTTKDGVPDREKYITEEVSVIERECNY